MTQQIKFGLYVQHFADTWKIEDQQTGEIIYTYVQEGNTYHVVKTLERFYRTHIVPYWLVTKIEVDGMWVSVDLYTEYLKTQK